MALSQNERVRAAIEGALDDKKDLTLRSVRTEIVNNYIKKHPSDPAGSVRSAFSKQFKSVAKERGISPEAVSTGKHVRAKYDPSLNMKVNPKPADVGEGTAQKATVQQGAPHAQAVPGQPGQPVQPQVVVYTAEGVGEMFSGLIETVRLKVPEIESLNSGQKNALGNLWLAPANRYLATHERAALIFLLASTAGIIGGHIVDGVRKHRQANEDKEERKRERQEAANDGGGRPPAEPAQAPPQRAAISAAEASLPENVAKLEADR